MISDHGEAMRKDIVRTVTGAVEMSKLVKENRYDEQII
jgi:hypothetical protein